MAETTNINKGINETSEKAAVELFNGGELLFGIIKTHKASLNAQITDNFVENNFAIHDHIAFQPTVVTLSGLIGDIILTSKDATQQAQDELEQAREQQRLTGRFLRWENYTDSSSMVVTKLGTFGMLVPQMSNVTQMAVNSISYAYSAINSALTNKWNNKNQAVLNNTPISNNQQTKIQQAYSELKDAFYARQPNKVYTPWAIYENMYIQGIEISQDEMNYIVDLSVTLKQLRFASVEYGEVNEQVRSLYNADAQASLENNGKAQMNSELYDNVSSDIDKRYKNG